MMLLPRKLGIGGAAVFTMSLFIGWLITPIMLKKQVRSLTALSKKGEMRENWANLPFPWITKFYLFNITNPEEIQNGAKPIVQQVGPYVYDEWRTKVDLVDHDEDDTVEYRNKDTWYFNASRSNGLTGDEELIFPHPAILSIVMFTAATKPTGMGVTSKAIDSIFKKPTSVFVRVKAREILFDGLPLDCTVKDFAGSAVCAILRTQEENFVVVEPNKYKVSLFGHTNGTVSRATTRVYRGVKKYADTGRVVAYDNQTIQSVWSADQCNMLNGSDGTIFHPFFPQDEDIVSFAPAICRSLNIPWKGKSKAYGINTNHYAMSLGDQSSDPEEKCFCLTPETCLKKGAMDLLPCLGSPIVLTMPHFYEADLSYLNSVDGLHPAQEDHDIYVDLEPMTGAALQFRIALQFNMFVYPLEKFKLMKTFPEALLPLFWVDKGIEVSDEIISQLKQAFVMITITSCLKWMMFVGGLGLMAAGGGLEYKRRMAATQLAVTAVTAAALAIDNAKSSAGDVQKWAANVPSAQPAEVPPSVDRN